MSEHFFEITFVQFADEELDHRLFYPAPFPDEFYEGYYGRLARLNGLPTKAQNLSSIVRSQFPTGVFPDGRLSIIELLAYSASMPLHDFVRNHTLLPYRRAVASHKPELEHGDSSDRALIRSAGPRVARPGAYFCVACIDEDYRDIGMSYWRRCQQLPGMYVCSEHQRTLSYVDKSNAFLQAPSVWIDSANVLNEQWAMENHNHPAVSRFLNLSLTLANSKLPFQAKKVRPLLAKQARERGIHISSATATEYLSDRIVSAFPAQWLETIFPGLTSKAVGTKLNQIDGVLYLCTCASSVAAYLLAFCVLFDSEQMALSALADAQLNDTAERNKTFDDPAAEWTTDLQAEYIRTRGNHSRIARENEIELHTVIRKLRGAGLPNLTTKVPNNAGLFEAAVNFYLLDHALVKSAELAGVNPEDLERIVRCAGSGLTTALKRMRRVAGPTKAGAPLGRTQLPHLISGITD